MSKPRIQMLNKPASQLTPELTFNSQPYLSVEFFTKVLKVKQYHRLIKF